jgi:hypothetical protein
VNVILAAGAANITGGVFIGGWRRQHNTLGFIGGISRQ